MELSEYLLETLREDDEFVLYRGERSVIFVGVREIV